DIWNVARDFFWSKLGVTGADLEFIYVDGGINVLLHHFLRDHNGIFKVVPVPRHERDEHIAAQREFAMIGIRTVSDDLTAFYVLAFTHDRFLIHASASIRAHKFAQLVNTNSRFGIRL